MNLWCRLLLHRALSARGPRLSLWDTAETRFRVVPTDLDVLGHMNNGRFATLMDLGRDDLMRRSGMWRHARRQRWYAVVAGQTLTYRRSLTLGQRFTVRTRVLGFDERWFYMDQRFVRGEHVVAHAVVRARFLDRHGHSVPHDALERLAGAFPGSLQVPGWVTEWSSHTRNPLDQPDPSRRMDDEHLSS